MPSKASVSIVMPLPDMPLARWESVNRTGRTWAHGAIDPTRAISSLIQGRLNLAHNVRRGVGLTQN